jgi:hypothetical protein
MEGHRKHGLRIKWKTTQLLKRRKVCQLPHKGTLMPSEISRPRRLRLNVFTYVVSKILKLVEVEIRMVVTRGWVEWGDVSQRVKVSVRQE